MAYSRTQTDIKTTNTFSISASPKDLTEKSRPNGSFVNMHRDCKRAPLNEILQKIYNAQIPELDWIDLNFNLTLTLRETFLTV